MIQVVELEYGTRKHKAEVLPSDDKFKNHGETKCSKLFKEDDIQAEVESEDEIDDYCVNCAQEPPEWRP